MIPMSQATTTLTADDGTLLSLTRHGNGDAPSAVLLCHGFIQNSRAWNVPSRSFIDALVEDGHAVYAVNLRGRTLGAAPGPLSHDLKDTVDNDAVALVDAVRGRHARLAWVGHSMGGLIGSTLNVDTARHLNAVVAIGTPLVPGRSPLHHRPITFPLMQFGRSMGRRKIAFDGAAYAKSFVVGRQLMDHPLPATLAPLPLWHAGAFSNDADLRYTLENAFDADSHHVFADLVDMIASKGARAGRLPVRERLQLVTAPMLAIGGRHDALAPAETVEALLAGTNSRAPKFVAVDAGHIDLLVGDAAPSTVWAPTRAFLREHLA